MLFFLVHAVQDKIQILSNGQLRSSTHCSLYISHSQLIGKSREILMQLFFLTALHVFLCD